MSVALDKCEAPKVESPGREVPSILRFRRLLRYREVCLLTGLSLTKVKELVQAGRIRSVTIDSSRRIPIEEIDRIAASGL